MLPLLYPLRGSGHAAEYDAGLAHIALRDFCETLPNGESTYRLGISHFARSIYNFSLPVGKTIFLDKTPRYYLIIPELRAMFPKAKFVFLIRNPLAVLASIIESWSGTDSKKLDAFRMDLEVAPILIGNAIKDDFGIIVDYSNLVLRPGPIISDLCRRLGIPYSASMLEYGSRPKPHGSMGDAFGIDQHSRPMEDSVNRWKTTFRKPLEWSIADEYLGHLTEDACLTLGYPKDYLQGQLDSIRPV